MARSYLCKTQAVALSSDEEAAFDSCVRRLIDLLVEAELEAGKSSEYHNREELPATPPPAVVVQRSATDE